MIGGASNETLLTRGEGSLGEHAEAYMLVLFEHVVLIAMFLMHVFIPNMPKDIEFKHYATASRKSKQTNPLATKILLEDTDGLRRPPFYPFLRGATQSISVLSMR